MIFPVKRLADLGFEILATEGTAEVLRRNGVEATVVRKHFEGRGPDGEKTTVQRILDGEIDLVINTPFGSTSGRRLDGYEIRTAAVRAASRASPPSRALAPRCRASRRCAAARSACARCRSGRLRQERRRHRRARGLGFGHVEIGTVTGEAQPGNPKPRLFRLLADRAV
jgi:hypothetical protein